MAFLYVLIAGTLASATNLCLRKNIQHKGNLKAYFTLYFILSLICSFILVPELFSAQFSITMFVVGAITGILNYVMMLMIARAVQIGPSGLTFAFQNSGSILPSFILFFLFGKSFGFTMGASLLIGFVSILIGLFLSARSQSGPKPEKVLKFVETKQSSQFLRWVFLVTLIFGIQGIILCLFFWKDLLVFPCEPNQHFLLPWNCLREEEIWFTPGFFLMPTIIETYIFWKKEKRWFRAKESLFGTLAGLFNGGAMFFLLLGAKNAGNNQKPILFPLFAISIIFLCSLWGKFLYEEKIHWIGMGLCLLGVLLGTF